MPRILCPAKINLILRIGPHRRDGFHELVSWMHKIALYDELELSFRPSRRFQFELRSQGLDIPLEKNILFKAAQLVREKLRKNFTLEIGLKKRIPTQAGLGGGSSDAAGLLLFLASRLNISLKNLDRMAAYLGSDLNLFLRPGAAFWCTGRGEQVSPLDSLAMDLVIVVPRRGISTGWAYQELDRFRKKSRFKDNWQQRSRLDAWIKDDVNVPALENDFEDLALNRFPELQDLKEDLAQSGAMAGQMSGSGSCFFGIYPNSASAKMALKFLQKKGWKCFHTTSL